MDSMILILSFSHLKRFKITIAVNRSTHVCSAQAGTLDTDAASSHRVLQHANENTTKWLTYQKRLLFQFEKQIKSVESVISHWSSHNQRRSKMPKIEIPAEFQPLTDALISNGNTFYCKTELSALQTILKLAVHYNDIG